MVIQYCTVTVFDFVNLLKKNSQTPDKTFDTAFKVI